MPYPPGNPGGVVVVVEELRAEGTEVWSGAAPVLQVCVVRCSGALSSK